MAELDTRHSPYLDCTACFLETRGNDCPSRRHVEGWLVAVTLSIIKTLVSSPKTLWRSHVAGDIARCLVRRTFAEVDSLVTCSGIFLCLGGQLWTLPTDVWSRSSFLEPLGLDVLYEVRQLMVLRHEDVQATMSFRVIYHPLRHQL